MAFCTECGAEVGDKAVVCVKCGSPIKAKTLDVEAWTSGKMWTYGILGFIIPLFAFIMGIIGLTKEPRRVQGVILLCVGFAGISFWDKIFGM